MVFNWIDAWCFSRSCFYVYFHLSFIFYFMKTKEALEKPDPKNYGYVPFNHPEEDYGWTNEGGQEAYTKALCEYIDNHNKNISMKDREELEKEFEKEVFLQPRQIFNFFWSEISERDKALAYQKEKFNQLREVWDHVDEYVRNHKEIKAFDSVSMTALKFIKERDGYKLESSKLQSKLETSEKLLEDYLKENALSVERKNELQIVIKRIIERNIETTEAIKKFVFHWDLYFESKSVGQPPDLNDLRKLI